MFLLYLVPFYVISLFWVRNAGDEDVMMSVRGAEASNFIPVYGLMLAFEQISFFLSLVCNSAFVGDETIYFSVLFLFS